MAITDREIRKKMEPKKRVLMRKKSSMIGSF